MKKFAVIMVLILSLALLPAMPVAASTTSQVTLTATIGAYTAVTVLASGDLQIWSNTPFEVIFETESGLIVVVSTKTGNAGHIVQAPDDTISYSVVVAR